VHVETSFALVFIALFPLLGAITNGLLGKRVFDNGPMVHVVAVGSAGVAALIGWWQFFVLMGLGGEHGAALRQVLFPWIHVGAFQIDFAFFYDPLGAVMVAVVTNVGFLIHLYSVGYMKGDPGYYRFFSYLNLFLFAMLCLVLGDNLVVMFLGWEGVGLCSYLLIGYWFEDMDNAKAGKKAFVVNRIGDFGFVLGMFLLFVAFGTLRPQDIGQALAGGIPAGVSLTTLNVAALLLFLGACGKSAQIPLYVWLPDAMAGPTPVSALIHAATMVTAGVYMIGRMNGLYFHAELASSVVLHVGAATALYSATIGLVQNDIKKVLAYSTVSQLGFMFAAMGAGAYAVGIFHLTTHAFFKALLFLGSGSVIVAMWHSQDMRHYGGLRKYMPITHWTFLIATLAISGIPFFAGFYSKDEILWWSLASVRGSVPAYVMLTAAAFCTAFYMFRIMWMTFWGSYRGVPAELMHHHGDGDGHGDSHHHVDPATWRPVESPWTITVPLTVLGILSVFGGYLGLTRITSFGVTDTNLIEEWLHPVNAATQVHVAESMHSAGTEWGLMGLSVVVALVAVALSYQMYSANPSLPGKLAASFGGLYRLVLDKYRIDELYDAAIVRPIERGSREILWKAIDVGVIDRTVHGVGDGARRLAGLFSKWQDGSAQRYALWMAIGVLLLCVLLLTPGSL